MAGASSSEQRKAYYLANPEYRAKALERALKWQKENRERRNRNSLAWVERNKEKHAANVKAWGAKNKSKRKLTSQNCRARRRRAEGTHTQADVDRIITAQRGRCAYCRMKFGDDYHVDHIIPIAAGGTNWPHNLQITCGHSGKKCNMRKNSKDPIDFARENGMLL